MIRFKTMKVILMLFSCLFVTKTVTFRLSTIEELLSTAPSVNYSFPLDSVVGRYGDPMNFQRERVNEGSAGGATQDLLFEGTNPRQVCPSMIGPFSDGSYYCTARENGYCDRRSGTCFCNTGYQGIDCSECQTSHYRMGNLCYSKKLCPNDCSNAGSCNYNNGTCACLPHRSGLSCEKKVCTMFSELCSSCNTQQCLSCISGYYLSENIKVCSGCNDFDPRCSSCTKELGCTSCADSLLNSVRRSGYRHTDPKLPLEENSRELSLSIPFGSKSPAIFDAAEGYKVVGNLSSSPLHANTTSCAQGLNNDDSVVCTPYVTSHVVCGNKGVFSFTYPNYHVNESAGALRLTVRRTGGGYGDVYVDYFVRHISTNDSDVSPTAQYTTSQTLAFTSGIVERSFLVQILQDNLPGPTKAFQVYLGTPVGGGILGAQFRTNVTIFDSDTNKISAHLTQPINLNNSNLLTQTAGHNFSITIQANNLKYQGSSISRRKLSAVPETMGGERFLSMIENDFTFESSKFQRNNVRKSANVTDNGDGTYTFVSSLDLQGYFQQRIFLALPNGLNGKYYQDTSFTNLAVDRIDSVVNFTWGNGRIIPTTGDFVSVRWTGAILIPLTGYYWFNVQADDMARLWINGDLILDHFTQQRVYREQARKVYLHIGELCEVEMEYLEVTGDAFCKFLWSASTGGTYLSPRDLILPSIIPSIYLYSLYEVKDSPIILTIVSDTTTADTTECFGDGLSTAQSGVISYFTCCPRDQYGNLRNDGNITNLASELIFGSLVLVGDAYVGGTGPDTVEVSRTYDVDTSCFNFFYTAQRGGLFELNVTYQTWYDQPTSALGGSPFSVYITSNQESGSTGSEILGSIAASPVNTFVAGKCYNFTIVARDSSGILRLTGGDTYETYLYLTGAAAPVIGLVPPNSHYPTMSPTVTSPPSFSPTVISSDTANIGSSSIDTSVRYGVVTDLGNGNYTVKICPIIAGNYALEVRYMGTVGLSGGDYKYIGLNVGKAPFSVVVVSSAPLGATSSVAGYETAVNVTVPTHFIVTVRDPYYNIALNSKVNITVIINGLPAKNVTIFNFQNGSYYVQYTPSESGVNNVLVKVNNQNVIGGPFKTIATDVFSVAKYTYVVGSNLYHGISGVISYFELFAYGADKKRISNNYELYTFGIRSADYNTTQVNSTGADLNFYNGTLLPCPLPPVIGHVACNSYDNDGGHYYGSYTPLKAGKILLFVFFNPDISGASGYTQYLIPPCPFVAEIIPGAPDYLNSLVRGDLYSSTAGETSYVTIKLKDTRGNLIPIGGFTTFVSLLQVTGTLSSYFGGPIQSSVTDTGDGTYIAPYVLYFTGEYVMRVGMLVPGLNATYFKSTSLGRLRGNPYVEGGILENTISWTGNIPTAGYSDYYTSQLEGNIDFDLRHPNQSTNANGTYTAFTNQKNVTSGKVVNPFRESYWSSRWVGTISAEHLEEYTFTAMADGNSDIRVYIGGFGTAFNSFHPGILVINSSVGSGSTTGTYDFRYNGSSEIIVEYVHYMEDGFFSLYWQSISTVLSVVPYSAFSNYQNISFTNVTVTSDNRVSSLLSTAYGNALTTAAVGVLQSFLIFSRDLFGNLVQKSEGQYPSMLGVGPGGVIIRGSVSDYGNGTYDVQYLPMKSGEYRMYVTIGCCPLHQDVGIDAEISGILRLGILVSGTPYSVIISPAVPMVSLMTATGSGLSGGSAGGNNTFSVYYRDSYKNPAQNVAANDIKCVISINNTKNGDTVQFTYSLDNSFLDSFIMSYSISKAGTYLMSVYVRLNNTNFLKNSSLASDSGFILGSPFSVLIGPGPPSPRRSFCQGAERTNSKLNETNKFQIELFDSFQNSIKTGGANYFIRILGANLESTSVNYLETPGALGSITGSKSIIPLCADNLNGRYICTYTMASTGNHLLSIKLLPVSNHPGGNGLTATYYDTYEGSSGYTGSKGFAPAVIKTDPSVFFSWPDGYIIPSSTTLNSDFLPLQKKGQSVRWEGYLVSPKTDLFQIIARVENMNATIYIDNFLIYDTAFMISYPVAFQESSAYHIRIEGAAANSVSENGVSISVMWSASTTKFSVIPQFFLYNSATEIFLSPFKITLVE